MGIEKGSLVWKISKLGETWKEQGWSDPSLIYNQKAVRSIKSVGIKSYEQQEQEEKKGFFKRLFKCKR